jgi:hypothetical protein
MRCILKGVQQTDQPGRFSRSENVSLYEDMSDLGETWSRRVWVGKAESNDLPRPS